MSFVSELEHELVRVGQERLRQRRRVSRFDFGRVVLAVAVASSLAVALVVLALVGHAPPSRPSSGPAVGIPPAAARLAAKLSVLRRPQTATDRSLPDRIAREAARGSYIPTLTRLAATMPGVKAFLVVSAPDPANTALTLEWPLALGDRVSLVVVTHNHAESTQPVPADGLGALNTVTGQQAVATVVPDGVARVRFTLMRRDATRAHEHDPPPTSVVVNTVTVNASVSNNVALAPPHGGLLVVKVQWYAANGRAIRTPDTLPLGAIAPLYWKPGYAQPAPAALAARLRSTFPTFASGPWSQGGLTVSRPSLPEIPSWLRASAIPSPGPPGFVTPRIYLRSTVQILTTSGLEAWVVPSSLGLCVYDALGGGCRGGLSLVGGAWGLIEAPDATPYEVGVLPRTNTTVTVLKNSGARWRIPVHDGVAVFDAIGVMRVEYKDAAGRPTFWH